MNEINSLIITLLVVQAGSDEADRKGTRVIKKNFKALSQLVDGAGAQVVFSVLSGAGMKDESGLRTGTISEILGFLIRGQLLRHLAC